ncbi:hypothetical protein R1flu_005085 [Riccia fluitans]|uniref:Uncharacterized protein n=1 Tax=Riccia fluitans TaxID=41844 RepID=A0ABD1YSP3_9MARC
MAGLVKAHAAVLLIPILILSIVIIGLSGWAYDTWYNPNKVLRDNDVSSALLGSALPAATLAIVAVISGAAFAMAKAESWVSAASALSTALVAWAFGIQAFGFACKHANVGDRVPFGVSDAIFDYKLSGQLKALSGVTIVFFFFQTGYLILLQLVVQNSQFN